MEQLKEPNSNGTTAREPKCPQGIIQWQHGSFEKNADGSLKLSPIKVDGRQLYSDPCSFENAIYTRYNASETFKVRPSNPQAAEATTSPLKQNLNET